MPTNCPVWGDSFATDGGVVRPDDDAVAAALDEGFGVDVDSVEVV